MLDRIGGGLFILLGNGDGTFNFEGPIPLPNGPTALVAGDTNNDGNLDLLVVNQGPTSLSVLLGGGDGTFQHPLNTPITSFPTNIVVGDFNADGKLDLAISFGAPPGGVGQVAISLGKGDGTFTAVGIYPAGGNPGAIQVADLNGDGRPDIVVEDTSSNSIYVLLGGGGGQFTPLPPVILGPGAFFASGVLVVADLNGDKRPDLIVGNGGANVLVVALGKGDGTFAPLGSLTLDGFGPSIAVADFNGDGKPDLVVVFNSATTGSVLVGKGDGTFLPAAAIPGTSQASSVLAADLDRDGRIDLLVTNPASNGVAVLRNTTGSTSVGGPVITLSNSLLQFTLPQGGPPSSQQRVSITNSGGGSLAWTATSSVPWLPLLAVPPTPAPPTSPFQTSGTAPSTLLVTVNPAGLIPGAYGAAIVVASPGAANSPQTISIQLTITGATPTAPPPSLRSVQNSASYASQVAQGSIFVVTGFDLGPAQLAQAPADSLPMQLAGTSVQVTIGGTIVTCPIAYTSTAQIAAILPSNTPLGQGTLQVTFNGQTSFPGQIRIVSSGVGVYTLASSGIGGGIFTDLNYAIRTVSQPAKPGDIVIAWATGLGPIFGNDASVSPTTFSNVEVFVGNQSAKVIAAGRSGCCTGLDQIAFEVPSAPLGCYVPVSIRVAGGAVGFGGSSSNFVTLPLSQAGEPCSNSAPGFSTVIVSKAASGQPVSIGMLGFGPASLLARGSFSLSAALLDSPHALAGQLSQALRTHVPEADVTRLLAAYQSGDTASAKKILARYAQAVKAHPSARKLMVAAADASNQQAAVVSFGVGRGIGLVGPEYASDFPATGTCTITQNFPADPSARMTGLDAGGTLTVNGPPGTKVMSQASPGQYSIVLGSGPSPTNTTPGLYTISGKGGRDIGPFSALLDVFDPLTWTNKSAVNIVDRRNSLTMTWSGGAASGHVLIGGMVRASVAGPLYAGATGAMLLCTENAQKGTFMIPQFVLSALSGGQTATLFIAPHPLDNPVSIPGLDLAFVADGSSDSKIVTIQ